MNLNVVKLWKEILKLSSIQTDKGELIVEDELAEGVEVFVLNENGELEPASDGEYEAEEKVIVVEGGKVVAIRVKEEEQPEPEQQPEEQPEEMAEEEEIIVEPEPEQAPEPDEKDLRIAELEARVAELEGAVAEKEARIAELEAIVAEQNEKLEMSSEKPAKEKVKAEIKSGALKYFQ